MEETGLVCGKLEFFMDLSGADSFYEYPNGGRLIEKTSVFVSLSAADISSTFSASCLLCFRSLLLFRCQGAAELAERISRFARKLAYSLRDFYSAFARR